MSNWLKAMVLHIQAAVQLHSLCLGKVRIDLLSIFCCLLWCDVCGYLSIPPLLLSLLHGAQALGSWVGDGAHKLEQLAVLLSALVQVADGVLGHRGGAQQGGH